MEKDNKTKKTNWKTTDNRFVAFLDLLGFKDKVMRKSHSEIYDELSKISAAKKVIQDLKPTTSRYYFEDTDIYVVSFSDSIVIFSKNDSYKNFEYFLVVLRYFFANAIKNKIAIKGGVAHGEVSINKSEQIYFGQPIIDAYFIEEDVNYLGVVCHNSIDSYLEKNKELVKKSKLLSGLLFEEITPLKCGKINHTNIDWFFLSVTNRNKTEKELEVLILENLKQYNQTVSGSARRYIDNTIDLFKVLIKEKKVNLSDLKVV